MMFYKRFSVLALVMDVVLLAGCIFLFRDRAGQAAMLKETTEELENTQRQLAGVTLKMRGNAVEAAKPVAAGDESSQMAQLKRTIDAKDEEISRLRRDLEQQRRAGGEQGRRRQRMSQQQWMEQLKTQNPERYEQMMADRERFRQEEMRRSEQREQLLQRLDRTRLTAEQSQQLAEYQALLQTQAEQRSRMSEGGNSREAMQEMMQTQRRLSELSFQVRDMMIEQYADSIRGGSGAAAAVEIRAILDVMNPGWNPGRGQGRR